MLLAVTDGCFVRSICYNDADCLDNQKCNTETGACEKMCFKNADCPDYHQCNTNTGVCEKMCFKNADCGDGYICDSTTHQCRKAECVEDKDCPEGFECANGRCRAAQGRLTCPEEMVPIEQEFCIDKYEASRPDATRTSVGTDETKAESKAGVRPWRLKDDSNDVADRACRAAGKRLCDEIEWMQACQGPEKTAYSYGNNYNATTCNGIDTYCYCDDETCQTNDPCPFPKCYKKCGADFHVEPTGVFEKCTNDYGVFDMNGNLWEHVLNGNDTLIRGGAYNCGDSEALHKCDYVPGNWSPDAKGFRCCADGWIDGDAGVESDGEV